VFYSAVYGVLFVMAEIVAVLDRTASISLHSVKVFSAIHLISSHIGLFYVSDEFLGIFSACRT